MHFATGKSTWTLYYFYKWKSFLEVIQILFLLEGKKKNKHIVKRSVKKTSSKYLAGTTFETIPSYSLQVEKHDSVQGQTTN